MTMSPNHRIRKRPPLPDAWQRAIEDHRASVRRSFRPPMFDGPGGAHTYPITATNDRRRKSASLSPLD